MDLTRKYCWDPAPTWKDYHILGLVMAQSMLYKYGSAFLAFGFHVGMPALVAI